MYVLLIRMLRVPSFMTVLFRARMCPCLNLRLRRAPLFPGPRTGVHIYAKFHLVKRPQMHLSFAVGLLTYASFGG